MTLGTSIRGPLLPLLVVSLAFFSSNSTTTLQGKHRAPTVSRSGDVAVIEDDGSSPPGVGIGLARQSGDRQAFYSRFADVYDQLIVWWILGEDR
jgi:hypothetical protein